MEGNVQLTELMKYNLSYPSISETWSLFGVGKVAYGFSVRILNFISWSQEKVNILDHLNCYLLEKSHKISGPTLVFTTKLVPASTAWVSSGSWDKNWVWPGYINDALKRKPWMWCHDMLFKWRFGALEIQRNGWIKSWYTTNMMYNIPNWRETDSSLYHIHTANGYFISAKSHMLIFLLVVLLGLFYLYKM